MPCWDVTSKERFAVVRMSFSVSKNHTLTSSSVISESESHCKRAYYDTLDLFILTLNDRFVTSLAYIKDLEKRANIAEKLKKISQLVSCICTYIRSCMCHINSRT
jgi:hypothetical protein